MYQAPVLQNVSKMAQMIDCENSEVLLPAMNFWWSPQAQITAEEPDCSLYLEFPEWCMQIKGSWALHSLTRQENYAAFKDEPFAHILNYIQYLRIKLVIPVFLLLFYWIDSKYNDYPLILNWYPEGGGLEIK